MKIVFFNKTLISGGIEKCIENLSKYLYKDYELEVVYTDDNILDSNIVNILSEYAKVYKIEDNMKINCDICIWCYLYFDYEKLKNIINANKYIAWIHSMPRILPDCRLDDNNFVNECSEFVCVSEAVKNNLNISKKGIVIHNFMNPNILELANQENPFQNDCLNLVVVSRLSSGKGFERLLKLCEQLYVDYNLKIVGKGRKKEIEIREWFKNYKNVEFVGYQENPYKYIKNADYLIQLSDDESWCNSITESKILGTPVVVTNFESSKEQITDGWNGIVVDLNTTDYRKVVEKMVNLKKELKNNLKTFVYHNEIEKWLEILK